MTPISNRKKAKAAHLNPHCALASTDHRPVEPGAEMPRARRLQLLLVLLSALARGAWALVYDVEWTPTAQVCQHDAKLNVWGCGYSFNEGVMHAGGTVAVSLHAWNEGGGNSSSGGGGSSGDGGDGGDGGVAHLLVLFYQTALPARFADDACSASEEINYVDLLRCQALASGGAGAAAAAAGGWQPDMALLRELLDAQPSMSSADVRQLPPLPPGAHSAPSLLNTTVSGGAGGGGGQQYVRLSVCSRGSAASPPPRLRVAARLAFRGAHGFLPASAYGRLPFRLALGGCYLLLCGAFLLPLWRHSRREAAGGALLRDFGGHGPSDGGGASGGGDVGGGGGGGGGDTSTFGLQYAVGGVAALGLLESALWAAVLERQSRLGVQACCPYDPMQLAAEAMAVLLGTACRVLLLAVAMGSGLVRERLPPRRWLCIALVAALYAALEAADRAELLQALARRRGSAAAEGGCAAASWGALRYLVSAVDGGVLLWICCSLASTTRLLHEQKQPHKLALYRSLSRVLCVSVVLVATAQLLQALLGLVGPSFWPSDWYWALESRPLTELVTFGMLAALCWAWRPSASAMLRARSTQLAQREEDEEEGEGGDGQAVGGGAGQQLQMVTRVATLRARNSSAADIVEAVQALSPVVRAAVGQPRGGDGTRDGNGGGGGSMFFGSDDDEDEEDMECEL